ncbi:MAG: hypothetical protein GY711_27670 [bacterium]|nr:hypothetical protein [bacterium]
MPPSHQLSTVHAPHPTVDSVVGAGRNLVEAARTVGSGTARLATGDFRGGLAEIGDSLQVVGTARGGLGFRIDSDGRVQTDE